MSDGWHQLSISSEELDCLLRAARKVQAEQSDELQRLLDLSKGEIRGASDAREQAATEFACLSSATRKLWRCKQGSS